MSEEKREEFTIHDLGAEVRTLTGLVSELKSELRVTNRRHERHWTTTVIANVSLTMVAVTLIAGFVSIRNVTSRLDEESILRAEENCQAIRDSRDVVRDILVIMTTQGGTDYSKLPDAHQRVFEERALKTQERTTEALSLLSDVDC